MIGLFSTMDSSLQYFAVTQPAVHLLHQRDITTGSLQCVHRHVTAATHTFKNVTNAFKWILKTECLYRQCLTPSIRLGTSLTVTLCWGCWTVKNLLDNSHMFSIWAYEPEGVGST